MSATRQPGQTRTEGGIGTSPPRPDGSPKVRGTFAFSSDLRHPDMLWGITVRSIHPHARLLGVGISEAQRMPGVHAVLTHEDVPGRKLYGQMVVDQPVLAFDTVRFHGEPIALVAADDPEIARRAAARVRVEYQVLDPVTDAERALAADAPLLQPGGNLVKKVSIRRGAAQSGRCPPADVVVHGEYRIGMQDQAFLGPESGLAIPADDGGVDLHVATQWLHHDQEQIAAALGMPPDKVRLTLAGVGGAFGGREDLSVHVHACMLALRTGRPVKMCYSRDESFVGHMHRHPGTLRYEHGATRDGDLVYVKADIVLDGGGYASSSPAVAANAASCAAGPYRVPHVWVDARVAYTNNPPCGAMRGFGAVQACFGYESQMDRLAAELRMHPVDLRIRNALGTGAELATGQLVEGPAPVAELLHLVRQAPPPDEPPAEQPWVARGYGYAVGFKNVGFTEGFDDYATARVRLGVADGEPVATITTAAAEVGQGLVTVLSQIVRTELGISRVVLEHPDTRFGSAGPSAASRQTYMSGGAVKAACAAAREELLGRTRRALRIPSGATLSLDAGEVVDSAGDTQAKIADVLGDDVVSGEARWHHPPTFPLDPRTGQGDSVFQLAFAAHRAVVDVDTELGTVRVVELATSQDVGKAVNPDAVLGQIQGANAQGLGLALMEEIRLRDGRILNPSLTNYLIPTILDVPPRSRTFVLELGDPRAPYGVRGVGEAPAISSTAAIVAAIRDATGCDVCRVPVRPQDIADMPEECP
jgi:xanthine dehydrogenase D subunit